PHDAALFRGVERRLRALEERSHVPYERAFGEADEVVARLIDSLLERLGRSRLAIRRVLIHGSDDRGDLRASDEGRSEQRAAKGTRDRAQGLSSGGQKLHSVGVVAP